MLPFAALISCIIICVQAVHGREPPLKISYTFNSYQTPHLAEARDCFRNPFHSVCHYSTGAPSKHSQNELLAFRCGFAKPQMYLLGKEIGRGDFGRVHLSLGVRSSDEIAIKVIGYNRKSYSSYKDYITAVETEHKVNQLIGIALHCPIVPKWYNNAKESYIAMRLVRGATLLTVFTHPANFTFSYVALYEETKTILTDTYHKNGYLHGDAHLGNFMLERLRVQPVDNGKSAKLLANGKSSKGFSGYLDLCHFSYRCQEVLNKNFTVPDYMLNDFNQFKEMVKQDRAVFKKATTSLQDCLFH